MKQNIQSPNTQFAEVFTSEKLLQQAVAGLLTRREDVSRVQILQGQQEYGKDIIFRYSGGFKEEMLCACVVKNTKITGNVADSQGARTVFNQAQQALDTPHLDETGAEVRVDRVYVISPLDMPPATMRSIQGAMKDRASSIVFITGAILYEHFRNFWPQFLAHEASVLKHHADKTTSEMNVNRPLENLAFQYQLGDVDRTTHHVYVQPHFDKTIHVYRLGSAFAIATKDAFSPNLITKQKSNKAKDSVEELEFVSLSKEGIACPWNSNRITQTTLKLNQLCSAFRTLKDESFCSPQQVATIETLCKKFRIALLDEWKRTVSFKGNDEVNPFLNMPLEKLTTCTQYAIFLADAVHKGISVLRAEIEWIKMFSKSKQLKSSESILGGDLVRYSIAENLAGRVTSQILISEEEIEGPTFKSHILREYNKSVLIVAPAGHGKTSFCRWNALNDAELYTRGKAAILPVYVQLYEYRDRKLKSFNETFLSNLGISALIVGTKQKGVDSYDGPIRVYLDGLDELPDEGQRSNIASLAENAAKNDKRLQIVLTARDYIFHKSLNWLPRIHLRPFNDLQIQQLVKKWLVKPSRVSAFNLELQTTPALKSLLGVPLLATLTILVFKQTGRLPPGRTKLYKIFVELLCGGWDLAKGVQRPSSYGVNLKQMVLRRIALRAHKARSKRLAQKVISAAVADILTNRSTMVITPLMNEIFLDGLLRREGDMVEFCHLSIQEYLAAEALLGDPKEKSRDEAAKEYFSGDEWWREVIRFYIDLSGNPKDLRLWLDRMKVHASSDLRLSYLSTAIEESYQEKIKTSS